MVVGHVSPEAAIGGPIALIEEGDRVTIDAHRLLLQLEIDATEFERRRSAWTPRAPRYTSGLLAKFAALASGAEEGAVTDKHLR